MSGTGALLKPYTIHPNFVKRSVIVGRYVQQRVVSAIESHAKSYNIVKV